MRRAEIGIEVLGLEDPASYSVTIESAEGALGAIVGVRGLLPGSGTDGDESDA